MLYYRSVGLSGCRTNGVSDYRGDPVIADSRVEINGDSFDRCCIFGKRTIQNGGVSIRYHFEARVWKENTNCGR